MSEEKTTNLFHANSVNTDDDESSKNEVIQGVRMGLYDYKDYINKSIEVIQKDGAIRIPLSKKEIRHYIIFHKFSIEEKERIKKLVFDKNKKRFKAGSSNKEIHIINKNEKENYLIFNHNKVIDAITIKLDGEKIQLDLMATTVYNVETDRLKNKDAKKIDDELFERETRFVFTEKPSSNRKENRENELRIITRNAVERYIVLNTIEKINYIYLKADDYQLRMQLKAIQTLIDKPRTAHTPLQKLFDLSHNAKNYFEENIELIPRNLEWKILNKPNEFDGTSEQQDFVIKALQTRDFALLEGPPGSGKTTAIIELIIQLIKQNKRVLLVSATHVAVDNVIHRILTTFKEQCEGLVVPIRIALGIGSIRKESVEPYELQTFIENTKNKITKNIRKQNIKKSGKLLIESIISKSNESDNVKNDQSVFDDIILKSANLVGGTMIGILKHPDIKKGGIQEMFDVMIVDESSKVTFLDFIVPALYAKKWILVGDVNQLSPYTEDDFINENIDNVLNDENEKTKLITSYNLKRKLNSDDKWDKESVKILFSKNHNKNDFPNYSVFRIPTFFKVNDINILKLNSVDIIIANPSKEHKKVIADHVFVKAILFEESLHHINFNNRQKFFHKNRSKKRNTTNFPFVFSNGKNQEWKEMVGSRLSQMYQYRFEPALAKELKQEYDFLVPDQIQYAVEKIRRVALPSILELLQIGVGKKYRKTINKQQLIYEGFNQFEKIKETKFQSLSYQHRMEDEIASIPREHFYTKNKNLKTANTIDKRDNIIKWYRPNEKAVIWVSNNDNTFRKRNKQGQSENINPTEVDDIQLELENFIKQAKINPILKNARENKNYEVAILTFYRAQVIELRKMLRSLSNQPNKFKFFTINNVEITLSTVDKFQGDEADMVLLSFTKFTKKAFYNSPNRLNVALTRARHKLILYGNKKWLGKNAQLKALQKIASEKDSRLKR